MKRLLLPAALVCALSSSASAQGNTSDDASLSPYRDGSAACTGRSSARSRTTASSGCTAPVPLPAHPLADQFLEAHKVLIHTAHGQQGSVVAIPNRHFVRQHQGDARQSVTVDQLWVDIGVSSRVEAEKARRSAARPGDGRASAVDVCGNGGRAGGGGAACRVRRDCDAVAQGTVSVGESVFILSAQHIFNWAGLNAALARLGPGRRRDDRWRRAARRAGTTVGRQSFRASGSPARRLNRSVPPRRATCSRRSPWPRASPWRPMSRGHQQATTTRRLLGRARTATRRRSDW